MFHNSQQMKKGNYGMMPVGENDRMIGAISDRDIAIRAIARVKTSGRRCERTARTTVRPPTPESKTPRGLLAVTVVLMV